MPGERTHCIVVVIVVVVLLVVVFWRGSGGGGRGGCDCCGGGGGGGGGGAPRSLNQGAWKHYVFEAGEAQAISTLCPDKTDWDAKDSKEEAQRENQPDHSQLNAEMRSNVAF